MESINYQVNNFIPYCKNICSDYYYSFRGRFNRVLVRYNMNNRIEQEHEQNDINETELRDVLDMLDIDIPDFQPIPNDYILINIEHNDNVMTNEDIQTMLDGWDIVEEEDKIIEIPIEISN